jgi:hypothetical protein
MKPNKWEQLKSAIKTSHEISETGGENMIRERVILNNLLKMMERLEKEEAETGKFLFIYWNATAQEVQTTTIVSKNAHTARHALWDLKGRNNVDIEAIVDIGGIL